ncbi:hypothetical protein Tco_0037015 [Tanacetum coccineum]
MYITNHKNRGKPPIDYCASAAFEALAALPLRVGPVPSGHMLCRSPKGSRKDSTIFSTYGNASASSLEQAAFTPSDHPAAIARLKTSDRLFLYSSLDRIL